MRGAVVYAAGMRRLPAAKYPRQDNYGGRGESMQRESGPAAWLTGFLCDILLTALVQQSRTEAVRGNPVLPAGVGSNSR
jgi:hypothetical protein